MVHTITRPFQLDLTQCTLTFISDVHVLTLLFIVNAKCNVTMRPSTM